MQADNLVQSTNVYLLRSVIQLGRLLANAPKDISSACMSATDVWHTYVCRNISSAIVSCTENRTNCSLLTCMVTYTSCRKTYCCVVEKMLLKLTMTFSPIQNARTEVCVLATARNTFCKYKFNLSRPFCALTRYGRALGTGCCR